MRDRSLSILEHFITKNLSDVTEELHAADLLLNVLMNIVNSGSFMNEINEEPQVYDLFTTLKHKVMNMNDVNSLILMYE